MQRTHIFTKFTLILSSQKNIWRFGKKMQFLPRAHFHFYALCFTAPKTLWIFCSITFSLQLLYRYSVRAYFQVFSSRFWFRRAPKREGLWFSACYLAPGQLLRINDRPRLSNTNLSVTDISASCIRVTVGRFRIRRVEAECDERNACEFARAFVAWNPKAPFIQSFIKLPAVELLINHGCNDDRNNVTQFSHEPLIVEAFKI